MFLHIHNPSNLYTPIKSGFVTELNLDLKHTSHLHSFLDSIESHRLVWCSVFLPCKAGLGLHAGTVSKRILYTSVTFCSRFFNQIILHIKSQSIIEDLGLWANCNYCNIYLS